MYISLVWEPRDEATADDVEADLDSALEALDFRNVFKPIPGFLFANTPGNTKSRVDDLQTELRKLPVRFAIAATQRGWLMWRSSDVDLETCKRIANYED